jgi:regulator of protease activity HflC (stomatin/prohibitin superfamily)
MDIIINKKPVSLPILPILALISLVALGLMSARIASVAGDEVGIFVNNMTGKLTVKTQTGSSIYNGIYTDFYTLKTAERTIKMVAEHNDQVRVKTGDGSDIELDIDVSYRMNVDKASIQTIAAECGLEKVAQYGNRQEQVDAYHERWIRDYSRSIVRHVFGELEPKEFYDAGKRSAKALQAEQELNRALGLHGIEITTVVPLDYTYYKEYKELIDEKKAADQEVENQVEEQHTAREDQKRQSAEADAKVKAKIAEVVGTLDKEFLSAQGDEAKARLGVEAKAYQKSVGADAAFTKAKNEAMAQLALAEAEAEGLKKLAVSLSGDGGVNLVKLKYAEVLRGTEISGVPYSTDPKIQKVELDARNVDLGGKK